MLIARMWNKMPKQAQRNIRIHAWFYSFCHFSCLLTYGCDTCLNYQRKNIKKH